MKVHELPERELALYLVARNLADAVRCLDSYAASSQVAPLERSQRADNALADWETLLAESYSGSGLVVSWEGTEP